MKTLNTLLAASALAAAFAVSANAAETLAGANAPASVGATGSIAKYINFTKTDNAISLGDLGGAQKVGLFESTTDAGTDGAEITWDANTHISVKVKNGAALKSDSSAGNVESDELPTQFRTQVKGRKVSEGATAIAGVVNTAYTGLGLSAPAAEKTYTFEHGPASGLKLDVQATRDGVDDHYGAYSTDVTLTFSDLN